MARRCATAFVLRARRAPIGAQSRILSALRSIFFFSARSDCPSSPAATRAPWRSAHATCRASGTCARRAARTRTSAPRCASSCLSSAIDRSPLVLRVVPDERASRAAAVGRTARRFVVSQSRQVGFTDGAASRRPALRCRYGPAPGRPSRASAMIAGPSKTEGTMAWHTEYGQALHQSAQLSTIAGLHASLDAARDVLLAGDPVGLLEAFPAGVRIDDQRVGRVEGRAALEDYCRSSAAWMAERQARGRLIASTAGPSRVVGEFELDLVEGDRAFALPVAVVVEPDRTRAKRVGPRLPQPVAAARSPCRPSAAAREGPGRPRVRRGRRLPARPWRRATPRPSSGPSSPMAASASRPAPRTGSVARTTLPRSSPASSARAAGSSSSTAR